ncbi:zonular occludens toxin domain-containing protein [Neptunomonas sp. XY-337]|uniref:zonular occludens toxin domain-containing protein n=1 Tax=Neptunomonas sp. XY-337 TaxID=2561897 RepID=UPI0010A99C3B|nr:zonular occludens toxin domain-containing protein [Neptunomonas sp. XY-337]
MIYLITGVPGSGKTLYTVNLLLEWIKENQRILQTPEEERKEGEFVRDIYVGIDGFDHDQLGTQEPPQDWRDTPDGSIVVYDECQKFYGPDGSSRAKREDIQAMETHRHSGHDLVLITQRERLLHPNIRDLVNRHYHIQRLHGSHNVNIFTKEEVINTSSATVLNRCDRDSWRYDKKLFKYYKSATVHTHKLSLPKWLKRLFVMALLLPPLIFGGAYFVYDKFFVVSDVGAVETPPDRQPQQAFEPVQPPKPVVYEHSGVMGCVVWKEGQACRCYGPDLQILKQPLAVCLQAADQPVFTLTPQSELDDASKRSARGNRLTGGASS